jgi:hypothetical protein
LSNFSKLALKWITAGVVDLGTQTRSRLNRIRLAGRLERLSFWHSRVPGLESQPGFFTADFLIDTG